MKTKLTILAVFVLVAVGGYFFLTEEPSSDRIKYESVSESDYEFIADDISRRIDDISPTPPTAADFTVTELGFVKGENLVYVVYNDSRNMFRILLEVQARGEAPHYEIKATFDKTAQGWDTKFGEDLGKDKELTIINF